MPHPIPRAIILPYTPAVPASGTAFTNLVYHSLEDAEARIPPPDLSSASVVTQVTDEDEAVSTVRPLVGRLGRQTEVAAVKPSVSEDTFYCAAPHRVNGSHATPMIWSFTMFLVGLSVGLVLVLVFAAAYLYKYARIIPNDLQLNTRARASSNSHSVPQAPATTSATAQHPCGMCDELCDTACSKCEAIYYCSKKCSKLGWKTHKSHCTPVRTVQAIYLPHNAHKPQLIDIIVKRRPRTNNDLKTTSDGNEGLIPTVKGHDYPHEDLMKRLECDGKFTDLRFFHINSEGKETVRLDMDAGGDDEYVLDPDATYTDKDEYGLSLVCRDSGSGSSQMPTPINMCVKHLMGGRLRRQWRGDMIVLREKCETSEQEDGSPNWALSSRRRRSLDDANLDDLGPIMRFLEEEEVYW